VLRCLERFSATLSHRSPEAMLYANNRPGSIYIYAQETSRQITPGACEKQHKQKQRAKRAEANGKSNEKEQHQGLTNTPNASREDMRAILQHLPLGVGPPSGTARFKNITLAELKKQQREPPFKAPQMDAPVQYAVLAEIPATNPADALMH
jgi:hypothetical protein